MTDKDTCEHDYDSRMVNTQYGHVEMYCCAKCYATPMEMWYRENQAIVLAILKTKLDEAIDDATKVADKIEKRGTNETT